MLSAKVWVRQAHLKTTFSATLDFASKILRPRFLKPPAQQHVCRMSDCSVCLWTRGTQRRTQTWLCEIRRAYLQSHQDLKLGRTSMKETNATKCSRLPCGELSLSALRAGEPAAHKHTHRPTYAAP